MNGFIRKLVSDRGFGFIKGQDDIEYFFHFENVNGGLAAFHELAEDDEVSFEPLQPRPAKGDRAGNVARVDRTAVTSSVVEDGFGRGGSNAMTLVHDPAGGRPLSPATSSDSSQAGGD